MKIVKVPGINGLGKTNGCEKSSEKILEFLKEIYTSESGKVISEQVSSIEEIELDNSNLEEANDLIYKKSKDLFELEGKGKTIFLGGDHSISYSIGKAFMDFNLENKKESCLIVFDAHPDLMPVSKGAEDYPTHEEWLRGLIDRGFKTENILLVGIRNSDPKEIKFMKEKGIKKISLNQLENDLEETCDYIMEFANGKELYLSLDIDVIDPVFAPSTGYQEPGGITSRQFIYLIQRLNLLKNLKAIDLVEINFEKDEKEDFKTIKLGAKILSELL